MPVMPQKLAGWRIEPPVSVPVAAGTRRAATAAAEPPDEPPGTRCAVPGVAHRAVGRVLVGRAHREFVAVELAQRHGAGRGQPRHHGGVEGAGVAGEHLRAGRRAASARVGDEDVLVRQRHAGQRRRLRRVPARRRRRGPAPARRRRRWPGRRRARALARRCVPADALRQLDAGHLRSRQRAAERRPRPGRAARAARLIRSPWAPGTGRPRPPARCAGWPRARSPSVTTSSRRRSAHRVHGRQRRVQRLDAARVDRAHLLDDAEEAVELLRASRPARRRSRVRAAPGGRCG